MNRLNIALFFFLIIHIPQTFASIGMKLDIPYSTQPDNPRNLLDIFYPRDVSSAKEVLIFIHGGSWDSGKKEMYRWLGKNMAKRNVVSVIINYRLSPEVQFEKIAGDCALSVKWVKENISDFGGNSDRIFVMGHSAGAHLAALINNDPRFFKEQGIPNPIRGVILNDGFGLDMFEYLNVAKPDKRTRSFLQTFSEDKEVWKQGSPGYYLDQVNNPYLILVGEKTYPVIKLQADRFFQNLNSLNKMAEYELIPKRRHKGMIIQMIMARNRMYDVIISFMRKYA